jgi:hypothetical protein
MREYEVRDKFTDFLVQHLGYPPSAVLQQYPLQQRGGSRFYADILLQDATRARLLGIVETKSQNSPEVVRGAFTQLTIYLGALGRELPKYVVVGDNTTKCGFKVFTQDADERVSELDPEKFPTYAALASGGVASETVRIQTETAEKTDEVQSVCRWAAVALGLVLILSLLRIYNPTVTQLGLMGAIVALLLLPNAAKLKGLGIEFERLKKEK